MAKFVRSRTFNTGLTQRTRSFGAVWGKRRQGTTSLLGVHAHAHTHVLLCRRMIDAEMLPSSPRIRSHLLTTAYDDGAAPPCSMLGFNTIHQ